MKQFFKGKAKSASFHPNSTVPKDLLEQAEKGIVTAQYQAAYHYENAGEYGPAFYWYSKASEKRYPPALYAFGRMHAKGYGVLVNHEQAAAWYEWAALRGHVDAQYALFLAYREGQGVTKDFKKAIFWLEKAAAQNHDEAQNKLGELYRTGDGVPQNLSYALYWFDRAMLNGCFSARATASRLRADQIPLKVPPKFSSQASALRITMLEPEDIDSKDLVDEHKLDVGGMSTIYRAKWRGQTVVVKKPNQEKLANQDLKEFEQEIAVLKELGHCAHSVHFYGREPLSYSIVIEYMPQGSLYTMLHSSKFLTWNSREQVCWEIALGLDYMHQHQILHRDLKSHNVLIGGGHAKLADFGLSASETNMSQDLVGSLPWLPPELLRSFKNPVYTRKTDIYSYGMVVWEVASSHEPFEYIPAKDLANVILSGHKEKISSLVPTKMAKLIAACWTDRPDNRPTAAEAYEQLRSDIQISNRT